MVPWVSGWKMNGWHRLAEEFLSGKGLFYGPDYPYEPAMKEVSAECERGALAASAFFV